ncbi:MAG: CBS domain-containing protein [Nitrospiraceae bacterium]|nr:MAG: CBS domain-containing protein [Nitrospiraceae bacterium]
MLKAKDIMTMDVVTVKPEATVEDLARLLMTNKISGVPVVDDNNSLVGIVTENDLISQNKRLHIPTVIRLFDAFLLIGAGRMEEEIRKMVATIVDEICIKKVVSVKEETTLEEIATIMAEQGIHLLPVLRDSKVIGIIGKADVVRAMTHEASE